MMQQYSKPNSKTTAINMTDQAGDLRQMVTNSLASSTASKCESQPVSRARIFSITSGKGGVGKTNIAVNLAYVLRQHHKKALIIDADLGLANVNILLGLRTEWNIQHVIEKQKNITDVILISPDHLNILPAGSGLEEMTNLTVPEKLYLKSQLDLLEQAFDIILIDTAAGISSNVMAFNQMAQEIMVVLSPDPTSLADAYALIKVLYLKYGIPSFHIITNNTRNTLEGNDLFGKLAKICQRFLGVSINHLGSLSTDPKLVHASRNQEIVVKKYPKATISKEIHQVAASICELPYDPWSHRNINFLLSNILNPG